ncbi:MAG: TatD family hydrolase [Alistipes putredinis]
MKCSIVDIHTHRPTGKALEPSFAGIHPWQAETRRIEEIVPRFGEVDLVGEIGLDYAGTVGREAQLRIFREQLDWAERLGKPVVLHCVKAFEAVMRELAPHALRAVIFHGFIGSSQQAAEAIKKGYYLSFGSGRSAHPARSKPCGARRSKTSSPKRTKATCRSRRFTAGSPKRKTSTLNC